MISKFLLFSAMFLFASCVSIERNNPDDPGSSYFGKDKMSGGLCGDFLNGTEREHYGKSKAQFCDARDGKKYVYVRIGSQTWLAENLNFNASGSKCYNDQENNCDTYGRLYSWGAAKEVCPVGWHLPSIGDWLALMKSINPGCYRSDFCDLAAINLKTTNGWSSNGNGIDDYGFSALPGGAEYSGDDFDYVGEYGIWWSASENNSNKAQYIVIHYASENVGYYDDDKNKSLLQSVRCLRDN